MPVKGALPVHPCMARLLSQPLSPANNQRPGLNISFSNGPLGQLLFSEIHFFITEQAPGNYLLSGGLLYYIVMETTGPAGGARSLSRSASGKADHYESVFVKTNG